MEYQFYCHKQIIQLVKKSYNKHRKKCNKFKGGLLSLRVFSSIESLKKDIEPAEICQPISCLKLQVQLLWNIDPIPWYTEPPLVLIVSQVTCHRQLCTPTTSLEKEA